MGARQAYEVGAGEYEDYQILALFEDQRDAQAFADHHNLTNIERISRGNCSPAVVSDTTVAYYPAGTWRPTSTQVIDGTLTGSLELTQH
ncbi:hypothetical protein [Micromonospora sp. WMMD737]|uniref:hypothetical protein n=1 Tax=Micromonospora sp. WMMD737 TaxID=3404113 RepID=UPI003B933C44